MELLTGKCMLVSQVEIIWLSVKQGTGNRGTERGTDL